MVEIFDQSQELVRGKTRVFNSSNPTKLEKEMATHSSIIAWKIPWTKEPGGLQSLGVKRVWHDWATEHTHVDSGRDCMQKGGYFLFNFDVNLKLL